MILFPSAATRHKKLHPQGTNRDAVPYHIITKMPSIRSNSSALNSGIGRARSIQNQDKASIALLNHFIVDVCVSVSIDDMNWMTYDIKLGKKWSISFTFKTSTSLRTINLVSPNHNKYPMGYFKCTKLVEYLIKAINLLRRLVPNRKFLKYEEDLAEVSGEKLNKGC